MVLKKIFSKRTLIISGVTYILILLVFITGYVTHIGGSFIDLGPGVSGIVLSAYATPFILIGSIIYIVIKKQNIKYVRIGYLILTLCVGIVGVGAAIAINKHNENVRI